MLRTLDPHSAFLDPRSFAQMRERQVGTYFGIGISILSIDGEIPGPANQDTYRVAAGPHEVEVAELIDDQDLPGTYTRARRHKNKTFTVDVRPDTTYMVASHLNEDRERDIIKGGYWDPVVWKEIAEPCR